MLARERYPVKLAADLLPKHHRVLVVDGPGQLIDQRAVLEQLPANPLRVFNCW